MESGPQVRPATIRNRDPATKVDHHFVFTGNGAVLTNRVRRHEAPIPAIINNRYSDLESRRWSASIISSGTEADASIHRENLERAGVLATQSSQQFVSGGLPHDRCSRPDRAILPLCRLSHFNKAVAQYRKLTVCTGDPADIQTTAPDRKPDWLGPSVKEQAMLGPPVIKDVELVNPAVIFKGPRRLGASANFA